MVDELSSHPDGGYPVCTGDNALLNLTQRDQQYRRGANALTLNTTGNVGIGSGALCSAILLATLTWPLLGTQALTNKLPPNYNLAIGFRVGFSSTPPATISPAIGAGALQNNTTGSFNTGIGAWCAQRQHHRHLHNTAIGRQALVSNTTGNNNTATGYKRSIVTTTTGIGVGYQNTATGFKRSIQHHRADNTANGSYALYNNINASYNTANGAGARYSNTTGRYNTATGASALEYNTIGHTTRPTVTRALLQHHRQRQHGQRSLLRSITTPPAARTRPTVRTLSLATQPATTTSH